MTHIKQKIYSKNTWYAKFKRIATSILPVDKNRKGTCKRCGACCKLPNTCPFLSFDAQDKAVCKIYWLRPLNCRKYPRSKSELITADTCGYNFEQIND
jgi:Fe-S-cluster containining protein